jgi:hypothetical protein
MSMSLADDGLLQVQAGRALLTKSGLVKWSNEHNIFESRAMEEFERDVRGLEPQFGRLMLWMWFSAGAEMFAKGVCLMRGVPLRHTKMVLAYPPAGQAELREWMDFAIAEKARTMEIPNYRTLSTLYTTHFKKLFTAMHADDDQRALVESAFRLLASTIRNRDAHAYVGEARKQHFWLIEALFVPALNQLASWVPDRGRP